MTYKRNLIHFEISHVKLQIFFIQDKSKTSQLSKPEGEFTLTHKGKLSGNDPGDFPETFSKKNFLLYCDVTTDDN